MPAIRIARIPACALDRQDACHTSRLHLFGQNSSGGSIISFWFVETDHASLVQMVCLINGRFPMGLVPVASMTCLKSKRSGQAFSKPVRVFAYLYRKRDIIFQKHLVALHVR